MNEAVIKPLPITAERFAPYGDVIHASTAAKTAMNDARFERFHDLANIDVDSAGGRTAISIARCKTATKFPYRIDMVERHPHGSQRAFVTNGTQGVNYHKGVWHMPLIAMEAGQEFLIVDRAPREDNCEEFILGDRLMLEAP
jgi:ureidoglycolate lyase